MSSGETVQGGGAAATAQEGGGRTLVSAAILFATAPAAEGGPAAALAYEGTTPLRRLLDQLASLGLRSAWVITRPAYVDTLEPSLGAPGLEVELVPCADPSEDAAAVARIGREGGRGLVLCYADIVTHRAALAGLIADPRLNSGILARKHRSRYTDSFGIRGTSARVLAAASPYHWVGHRNGFFLGVVRVDAGDLQELAEVAEATASLLKPPLHDGWRGELDRKTRVGEHYRNVREHAPDTHEVMRAFDRTVASEDVLAVLLVGLVRGGTRVNIRYLRSLFWDRLLSEQDSRRAAEDIRTYDEDRVLLDSAVKVSDGFFTTFFVSPYSRYIARFAARRGLTPNQVTVFSMFLGVLAAAGFATGERGGLVTGALLLQVAFTFDCVDGQLARYTRTFSRFGAWLDSVFDRGKEYLVYAGLAIGSTRGFDVDVWALAASTLTLQTVRHMFDFSFGHTHRQAVEEVAAIPFELPGDGTRSAPYDVTNPSRSEGVAAPAAAAKPSAPRRSPVAVALRFSRHIDRAPGVHWLKKIVVLPIGERFALISLTAALFTPQTTFIALLVGGGAASVYSLSSRVMQTVVSP